MTDYLTRDGTLTTRRRLIEAAQQGDHRAQHQLLRSYEPLVRRVVWRLRLPPGCERADLAQEARLGLLAAIGGWRPERGPFPAFADRCVRNQALLAIKAACARKHQVLSLAVALDAPAGDTDDGSLPGRLDTLPAPRDARTDPEAHLLVKEQLTILTRARATLTAGEDAGLSMILNGESLKHPPPAFNGTPKAASQAAYRARLKLAAALAQAA